MTRYELTEQTAGQIVDLIRSAHGMDAETVILLIYPYLVRYAEQYPDASPNPTLAEAFAQIRGMIGG